MSTIIVMARERRQDTRRRELMQAGRVGCMTAGAVRTVPAVIHQGDPSDASPNPVRAVSGEGDGSDGAEGRST